MTDVALPVSEDIFCSGITILENGNVMSTGGNIEGITCSHTASGCGTQNVMPFNPTKGSWTTGKNMIDARWYREVVASAHLGQPASGEGARSKHGEPGLE
jgi:hypothetical protein